MKKIIIAFFLSICFPILSFANKQNEIGSVEVTEVSYTFVTDDATGKVTMKPRIVLSFTQKGPSAEEDTETGVIDGAGLHVAEKYEIYKVDKTANTEEVLIDTVEASTSTYEITTGIEAGKVYGFKVVPYHMHEYTIDADGNKETRRAPSIEPINHPYAYAMTDLNTKVEGEGKKLTVTWEDLGDGINYDIYYEKGDIDSIGNMNGRIQLVKDESTKFVDKETFRARLKYTISNESIVAGQIYSVIVVPNVTNIDGVNLKKNPKPYIATGSTEIPLDIYEQGEKYVRLVWFGIDNTIGSGGGADEYSIKEVHLLKKDGESGSQTIIAKIFGEDAVDIGYYTDIKPSGSTFYKIKLIYTKIEGGVNIDFNMESDWKEYNPEFIKLIPIKPEVPNYGTKLSGDDNGVADLSSYKGALNVNNVNNTINYVWSSFRHADYDNETEDIITNYEVFYDVWVTDSLEHVHTTFLPKIEEDIYAKATKDTDDEIKNVAGDGIGFRKTISQYVKVTKDEALADVYTKENLVPNKIYYLKVVAKRKIGDVYVTSQPNVMAIFYDYNGNVYTPRVIAESVVKEKEVLPAEVTVEWKKKWFEITDIIANDKKWVSKVWTDGTAVHLTKQDAMEEIILDSTFDIDRLKTILTDATFSSRFLVREVELGDDIKYEFRTEKYEDVLKYINEKKKIDATYSLSKYLDDINKEIAADSNWNKIEATEDTADITKNTFNYKKEELEENTAYLMLLRGYREIPGGSILYATYPSPLVITTTKTVTPPVIDPTVPNLMLDSKKDTEAVVKWEYNTAFTYTVYIGEEEDFSKSKEVEYTVPTDNTDSNFPADGKMFRVTLKDLFPKSGYYLWIRSKQANGSKESKVSNALHIITEDVLPEPLLPPDALGIGSEDDAIGSDYITIEWLREEDDVKWEKITDRNIVKEYSYVIEAANNLRFLDSEIVEVSKTNVGSTIENFEVISMESAKFKNLEANKKYYFKIKTKLVVKDKGSDKSLSKESEYSSVRIFSTAYGNEYDGDVDKSKIEDRDMIVESYDDHKWKYVIYGHHKFINEFLKNEGNEFEVDMEKYGSKTIRERKIVIPKTAYKALLDEKITLDIKTRDNEYKLPVKAIGDLNKNYREIIIKIKESNEDENFDDVVSEKEKLEIMFKTDAGYEKINSLEKDIEIKMEVNSYYDNYKAYAKNEDYGKWEQIKILNFDSEDDIITARTNILGTYLVNNQRNVRVSSDSSMYINAVQNINNVAEIENINYLNENASMKNVNANQIVYGLLMRKDTTLKDSYKSDIEKLMRRAGFDLGNKELTNYEAIKKIVRFYEIKSGEAIEVDEDIITNSDFSDIAILKGIQLGIASNNTNIYAKISVKEFLINLNKVLNY
ncbi:MAG: hypothetical protein N4A47_07420 [Clostridia bacterium]|jgi:hypothetical protein|nr:hypothetical protein [Clostridia bacterium]